MIGTLRPRQAESLRRHGRTFAQTCRTLRAAAGLYFRKLPSIARYADLDAELVDILRRYNEILRRSRSGLPDSGISVDFTNLRSISTDFPNLEPPPQLCIFCVSIVFYCIFCVSIIFFIFCVSIVFFYCIYASPMAPSACRAQRAVHVFNRVIKVGWKAPCMNFLLVTTAARTLQGTVT